MLNPFRRERQAMAGVAVLTGTGIGVLATSAAALGRVSRRCPRQQDLPS